MSVRIGHISGVPVRIHATCAIVFFVISYTIGIGFIAETDPALSPVAALAVGAAAAALLLGCLVLHELGHVVVARRFGVTTRTIDLFLLGGESKLDHEPDCWRQELGISVAGPLVSLALAPIFWLCFLNSAPGSLPSAVAFYLAYANALIGVANLLPGYPLDGGRALYAALWGGLKSRANAMRISALAGQSLGLASAVCGAVSLFGSVFSGVMLILVGWYIFNAAAGAWEERRPCIVPAPDLREGGMPARG